MKKLKLDQKIILALFLVGSIGAIYWAFFSESEPTAQVSPGKPVPHESRDSIPPAEEGLANTQAPKLDDTALEQIPDSETVHAQGGEDPHATPRVLMEFAHQLAGLMEKAMDSEQEAGPVFAQLETCAENADGKEVIQARLICFANASRLGEQYPDSLGTRFQLLSAHNPNLVGMLQASGL